MTKKIYDIKPPKMAGEKTKEHRVKKAVVHVEKKVTHSRYKKEKKSSLPVIWGVVGVLVLVLAVYLFFKLPQANITIWPKVSTLSFQQTVIADKSADSVDLASETIPAQYFEAQKIETQDFPATGNASNVGQATGTITITNKNDPPSSLSLKAGTHFLSDSGKYFVSLSKVVVPAAKKNGSKITPGSVQVQVQAVEGGDSYNIAPSSFSIPGLNGTAYFYSVTATSTSAMTGGYSGSVKKVTDDDISGAKDVLTKKATADATDLLKSKISSDYVLLDDAVSTNVTSASTQTKSGTVAQNFTYQVTVETTALAFKKSDFDQFAKNYIVSQMPESGVVLDSSYKSDYSVKNLDVTGGKETLSANFSAGVYQSIDPNSLALSLMGKNGSQINGTISNNFGDSVSKVKVSFWPFWVTSAPENQAAIKIILKF